MPDDISPNAIKDQVKERPCGCPPDSLNSQFCSRARKWFEATNGEIKQSQFAQQYTSLKKLYK